MVALILRWSLYLALLVGSLAACASQPQPPRPQGGAATEAVQPATSVPEPTATPTATPLPPAVLQAGALPIGRIVFSVGRAGEADAGLWRMDAEGLHLLRTDVTGAAWDCAGAETLRCAVAAGDDGLYAFDPISRSVQLLDVLDGWPLPAAPLTPTIAVAELLTEPLTLTMPLTPTVTMDDLVTEPLTATQPISGALPSPTLALSPDGTALAALAFDQLRLYDLTRPALLAALPMPTPTELTWSPDGQWLAVAADADGQSAIWLWDMTAGRLTSLAQMEGAAHLAWSPDSSRLAFDARTTAATPGNQSDQSDIFIWQRDSNEISNVTDLFLTNGWTDPAYQIAAWSPQWEADGAALRYLRGLPAQPDTYTWARQELAGNHFISILPVAVETEAVAYPVHPLAGVWLRRIPRDGREVLQQSADGETWQDAGGTFAAIRSVVWQPAAATAKTASPRLLVADRQSLLLLDPVSGALSGLAVTCAACEIGHAVWLP